MQIPLLAVRIPPRKPVSRVATRPSFRPDGRIPGRIPTPYWRQTTGESDRKKGPPPLRRRPLAGRSPGRIHRRTGPAGGASAEPGLGRSKPTRPLGEVTNRGTAGPNGNRTGNGGTGGTRPMDERSELVNSSHAKHSPTKAQNPNERERGSASKVGDYRGQPPVKPPKPDL